MNRTDLAGVSCSIARSTDVVGDPWNQLILRDVFSGITRYESLARDLPISRKVLAARLDALVDGGILERVPYSEHPPRHEYTPTAKGAELYPILLAIMAWGDRWTAGAEGPPALVRHDSCGAHATAHVTCSHCGEPLTLASTTPEAGPGGTAGPGTEILGPILARNARS